MQYRKSIKKKKGVKNLYKLKRRLATKLANYKLLQKKRLARTSKSFK